MVCVMLMPSLQEFEVLEKLKLDEVVYDDVVEPAEAPVEYQEPEEINSMDVRTPFLLIINLLDAPHME